MMYAYPLHALPAHSHPLTLSRPQCGVSKGGREHRACCPPFETHRYAMLLRVRESGLQQGEV